MGECYVELLVPQLLREESQIGSGISAGSTSGFFFCDHLLAFSKGFDLWEVLLSSHRGLHFASQRLPPTRRLPPVFWEPRHFVSGFPKRSWKE